MKITVNAAELAGTLALAVIALDAKNQIESLHAVHIKAAGASARLAVNTLDRMIVANANAHVAKPGETVVRAATLARLAAGFPWNDTIEIEADAHGAKICCGRSRYKLAVMPIGDLPRPLIIDPVIGETDLAREDLLEAIRQVTFAASTEATRYYLNGIFLGSEDGQLVAVATDGHRLGKCRIAAAPLSQDRACILPLTTIVPVARMLGKAKAVERVKLRRSRTLIEIAAPDFAVITSKLIDGTYPDYQRVIPTPPNNSATVDRDDLVAALARLAAVAMGETRVANVAGIEWSPSEPALRLSLASQTGTAEDIVAATITGNATVRTAAQLAHVTELASALRGKSARIASNGENGAPILITDPDNSATTLLQMPCLWPGRSSRAAA